ncbi:MAG TPA: hypothetical protein EYN69_02505 [Flavobacteriales bacterium]|nr:hypothetical protein [Flavobacteriales bacterium]
MKKWMILGLVLSLSVLAAAQKVDVSLLKGMKVRSIGPAGMSGRVTSIDVVLSDPDIIYVGTASGGLWRSESGGISWTPLFDKQPVQSIGAVAIDQKNPDVIWAGTGEGNPRNSQTSGAGIFKSINGGKDWKLMGLKKTKTIHRIIIHRDNPDIVYVASLGSAWGPNTDRGVFRTVDGGKTWKRILYINNKTGAADLVVDPTNPNKLIAAMWEYGRKPWTFNSGGKGSGIHVSFDGGDTWEKRTDKQGLPKGELGRIGLAIAPSMPNIVYALVESKKLALYKSTDGGFKWSKVSDKNVGNRPFYYADIYVDPKNENRIYNLWSYTTLSEDGGKTFKQLLNYGNGVHPDHHAFWIHPEDPNYLINGNDGGLNISRDRGKNWRFIENLPLGQFYHINMDMDQPYNIYGGMQDNGSWRGPAYIWQRGGIRNSHWQELLFGDGFDVVPNPKNSRKGYAMYQGGTLHSYDMETGRNQYIQPIDNGDVKLRFNWNAGIAQDPFDDCGVYFGSQFLHKSTDCGQSWEVISPDLTTNDSTKQEQAKSGGLTIDATQAENYTTIISISPSPLNKDLVWVGTDDGKVQITRDGGKTWINLFGRFVRGAPPGSWIAQISASAYREDEAFVVINNYRRNDWNPYIYRVTEYGKIWVQIVDAGDVSGHALSFVQDPVESKLMFVGAENGLYFSIDGGAVWNKWRDDYPSVSTMDLKIHPREGDLIIGTFGRAVYVLDDLRPLRELAQSRAEILKNPFHVFESPTAVLAEYKSVGGVRFTAQAHFKGANRVRHGRISFYIKELKKDDESSAGSEQAKDDEDKDEDDKKDKDDGKVKVEILNSAGDTVRTYKMKPDTGLNRISWNLRLDGVRYPTWDKPKEDEDLPSGRLALPGDYKIILTYGEHSGSTMMKIVADPRENVPVEDLKAKADLYDDWLRVVTAATNAFDRMKKMKKTVSSVNGRLENVEDTLKKEIKKEGKAITRKADEIMGKYMLAKDFIGYDHVTYRLMDYLVTSADYINSGKLKPSKTALNYFDFAKKEVQKVLDEVTALTDKEWAAYKEKVEKMDFPIFKDFDSIEIKK